MTIQRPYGHLHRLVVHHSGMKFVNWWRGWKQAKPVTLKRLYLHEFWDVFPKIGSVVDEYQNYMFNKAVLYISGFQYDQTTFLPKKPISDDVNNEDAEKSFCMLKEFFKDKKCKVGGSGVAVPEWFDLLLYHNPRDHDESTYIYGGKSKSIAVYQGDRTYWENMKRFKLHKNLKLKYSWYGRCKETSSVTNIEDNKSDLDKLTAFMKPCEQLHKDNVAFGDPDSFTNFNKDTKAYELGQLTFTYELYTYWTFSGRIDNIH